MPMSKRVGKLGNDRVGPYDPALSFNLDGGEDADIEVVSEIDTLTGYLTDNWSIATGYAYLDGEVERADGSGNDGNVTRQTPENMFSIWNSVEVTDRLRLGFGATYQDSFFVTEDNSVLVPSYTRVDAAAYYRLNDSTRLQLNVENLLDEEYFPDAHSNTNISTGRPLNARVSVIVEF